MASFMSSPLSISEFFPPTLRAWSFAFKVFATIASSSLLEWLPFVVRPMGKTSTKSRFNVPGRIAWVCAELVGPVNLIYILFNLPSKIRALDNGRTGVLGAGLPVQNEIVGFLYILHYINRALITPIFIAPSVSPMSLIVAITMALFQFTNSTNIGCWLVYSTTNESKSRPLISLLSILGIGLYCTGLAGNFLAERTIHALRRGAAKRRAKSEGKAQITYDKVYVIPPAEGFFRWILYPHYALEWLEWTGYWILAGAWGLGWGFENMALCFLLADINVMWPRAVAGRRYYEQKFGRKAVAGRGAAIYVFGL